jgi:sodium-dependent dicarboxylate transporter 2/3/5
MNAQLIITLVVMVLMICGFLSGKFKLGLVAMAAATVLCLTGVLKFDEAYANFANKNVIMIGGMFILSGALSKTSLVPRMRDFLVQHGDRAQLIIMFYILANAILIQFSMPTALISMFLPFMASFDSNSKVQPQHLLFPGAVVAHCFQGLLPSAYFVMINGLLEANNAGVEIQALDYSKILLLPSIIAFIWCAFVAWRFFPKSDTVDTSAFKSSIKEGEVLTHVQETIVYIAFIANLLVMLFSSYIPISMYVFPVAVDILLCFLGILNFNDIKNFINLDTLFMLVGVMPIGTAMQKTGAGQVVSDAIMAVLGGHPSPLVILFAFYFAGAILTQFMSNTATQQAFVPLAIVTCLANGLDPRPFSMAIYAGCTAAMLTPTGSPSCAIAFGAGNYNIKNIVCAFLPLWILYGVAVCLSANFFFPLAG